MQAVLASLQGPLVGRHALPLFLYNVPLFPHVQMQLHLFEPRYKLLCRKALKADRLFGFVTGSIGSASYHLPFENTGGCADTSPTLTPQRWRVLNRIASRVMMRLKAVAISQSSV